MGVAGALDVGVAGALDVGVAGALDVGVAGALDVGVAGALDVGVVDAPDLGVLWPAYHKFSLSLPLSHTHAFNHPSPSCTHLYHLGHTTLHHGGQDHYV